MISVAIIEDIADTRNGIAEFLNGQRSIMCKTTADSIESFLANTSKEEIIDVLLLDIGLPGMSGISGIKLIKERYPDINILMLTVYEDSDKVFEAVCAGAVGYLIKNTPLIKIKEAVEDVYTGGAPMSAQIARKVVEFFNQVKPALHEQILTFKEKEIVAGLVDGLSYKMIAAANIISIETVRFHIKNIYRKLHVNCKAEVITKSLRGEI
ncbi:MAG: response regulator transcription factor [Bacteroidetes bacterium]|nr:response regulator transcription factor [Bacteroidota bacterium]